MSTKPKEFWIEFSGDPSDDKECYKRYVSGTEFKPILPECEVLHVREVLPNEVVLDRDVVEKFVKSWDDWHKPTCGRCYLCHDLNPIEAALKEGQK